jgi:hypothetical protein
VFAIDSAWRESVHVDGATVVSACAGLNVALRCQAALPAMLFLVRVSGVSKTLVFLSWHTATLLGWHGTGYTC